MGRAKAMKRPYMASDAKIEAKCAMCDARFFKDRSTAKYCSDACKVAAHRERKATENRFNEIVNSIENMDALDDIEKLMFLRQVINRKLYNGK